MRRKERRIESLWRTRRKFLLLPETLPIWTPAPSYRWEYETRWLEWARVRQFWWEDEPPFGHWIDWAFEADVIGDE